MRKAIFILLFSFLAFITFYYFYFFWYSYFFFPEGKNLNISPPKQPFSGPGGREYLAKEIDVIFHEDYFIFLPKGIDLKEAPIILLLEDPIFLFRLKTKEEVLQNFGLVHLVKNGNIVILPMYQKSIFDFFNYSLILDRTTILLENSFSEIKSIAKENKFDKFSIIGLGSGASLSTHLLEKNIPQPNALILIAPYSGFPLFSSFLFGIPLLKIENLSFNSYLITILAQNDRFSFGEEIFKIYQEALVKNKFIFKIPSDNYGVPSLVSNKGTIFRQYSALNYYGTMKIIDAVLNCAFHNLDCQLLSENKEKLLEMGEWSDGKKVQPIIEIKF
jgi:hypothetical protein